MWPTPDQPFTAGDYSRPARAALREIAGRGRLPIVTGGTGLYLRALTEGLVCRARRGRKTCGRGSRRSAKSTEARWLHRVLDAARSASAARIHANDTPKLIRAIEVCLAARRPMSEVLMARDPLTGFRLLRIGLNPPRRVLYDRLNQRCAAMFAAGLVEETRGLLARYGPVKALDSLGYRQARAVLAGAMSRERSHRRRAAGPPQLRQAADDLVPARAGCALDRGVRRRAGRRVRAAAVTVECSAARDTRSGPLN